MQVLDRLDEEPSVRCVLLSGNGHDFTSGVDLKNFMEVYSKIQDCDDPAKKTKLVLKIIQEFQAPFKKLNSFTKPVISILHGLSLGLAMELAACTDIRYCSLDARMAIREVLIGIAADTGSLQKMPNLVSNKSLLMELIFTGRDITPKEALQFGFVSSVYQTKDEALDQALKLASTISSRSPVAVMGSKRNLKFSENKPFEVGLDYNSVWNMSMMQGQDVVKAVAAIMSKSDDVEYDDF